MDILPKQHLPVEASSDARSNGHKLPQKKPDFNEKKSKRSAGEYDLLAKSREKLAKLAADLEKKKHIKSSKCL